MLLKLVMDCSDDIGQIIQKWTVVKWYKQEGDAVNYGDHVLDLRVEELRVPKLLHRINNRILEFKRHPSKLAQMANEALAAGAQRVDEPGLGSADQFEQVRWVVHFQINSSDQGILRRICAREGERRRAGDLLALLTTDATEPISEQESAVQGGSLFRFVANVLDTEPNFAPERWGDPTKIEKARAERKWTGDNFAVFWADSNSEERIGVYALGGCDLPVVFACVPLIHPILRGRCGITYGGRIWATHSSLLLQSLAPLPQDAVNTLVRNMRLDPSVFRPRLLERNFVLPGVDGPEEFPKTVIVLSIGADVTRVLYRHREHGFLVDPGGGWLDQQMTEVLAGAAETTNWFRKHYQSIGKVAPEAFKRNVTRIVEVLKSNGHEHILVFNLLAIEPESLTHNYQFVRNSEAIRRQEFNVALLDLSRELDFSVVDVDRILKRVGIRTQVDWSHADPRVSLLMAQEMVRIMQERGVFSDKEATVGSVGTRSERAVGTSCKGERRSCC